MNSNTDDLAKKIDYLQKSLDKKNNENHFFNGLNYSLGKFFGILLILLILSLSGYWGYRVFIHDKIEIITNIDNYLLEKRPSCWIPYICKPNNERKVTENIEEKPSLKSRVLEKLSLFRNNNNDEEITNIPINPKLTIKDKALVKIAILNKPVENKQIVIEEVIIKKTDVQKKEGWSEKFKIWKKE